MHTPMYILYLESFLKKLQAVFAFTFEKDDHVHYFITGKGIVFQFYCFLESQIKFCYEKSNFFLFI